MMPKSGYRFRKTSCAKKKLERDDDSKKSHHALAELLAQKSEYVVGAAVGQAVANIVRHALVGNHLGVRDVRRHFVVGVRRADGLGARIDDQGRAYDLG